MAAFGYEDPSDIHADVGPQGHNGQYITGTMAAALAGHGFTEEGAGETHMDPIMRAWAKATGRPAQPVKVNKAMEVGLKMEKVAYEEAAQKMATGKLNDKDKELEHGRLYEAHRGLFIVQEQGEGKLPLAANIDGPIIDVRGTYKDPVSDEEIEGWQYASRQAQELEILKSFKEANDLHVSNGGDPIPIPDPLYDRKMPYLGVCDIKVTMLLANLQQAKNDGVLPGYVVQTAFYNMMLREENRLNGFSNKDYSNSKGIYYLSTQSMSAEYFSIPHSDKLEAAIKERIDLFNECVRRDIPPNSPEMRDRFAPIDVSAFQQPEAVVLLEGEDLSAFQFMLGKLNEIDKAKKSVKAAEEKVHAKIREGMNMEPYRGKNIILEGPDGKVVKLGYGNPTTRTQRDDAKLTAALASASESQKVVQDMLSIIQDPDMTAAEKLAAMSSHEEALENFAGAEINAELPAYEYKKTYPPKPDGPVKVTANKGDRATHDRATHDSEASRLKSLDNGEKNGPAGADKSEAPTSLSKEKEKAVQEDIRRVVSEPYKPLADTPPAESPAQPAEKSQQLEAESQEQKMPDSFFAAISTFNELNEAAGGQEAAKQQEARSENNAPGNLEEFDNQSGSNMTFNM